MTNQPSVTTCVQLYLEAVAEHGEDSAQARALRTEFGALPGFDTAARACDVLRNFSKNQRIGFQSADDGPRGY